MTENNQDGGNFLLNVRNLTVPFGLLLAERGLKKLIESNSKKTPAIKKSAKKSVKKDTTPKPPKKKSVKKVK